MVSEGLSSSEMKKKVLLMGTSGSGKTSMKSIIFANYTANDTKRLGATIEVEHSHVKLFGHLILNFWDCGGQEAFIEDYFLSQRDDIFKNVEVLIYVFNIKSRDEELKKDYEYYQTCLSAIHENSPSAQVFCLLHKIDLLRDDQKNKIILERKNEIINISKPINCVFFKTSIWDETLFKAWSSIIHELIPNIQEVEQSLKKLGDLMGCDEVLLFERSTFIVISSYERVMHHDKNRSEKVSSIIKRFKSICTKISTKLSCIEIKNSKFTVLLDVFTSNTFIMVVMSDLTIESAAITLNIKNAREHFEELECKKPDDVFYNYPVQPVFSTDTSTDTSISTNISPSTSAIASTSASAIASTSASAIASTSASTSDNAIDNTSDNANDNASDNASENAIDNTSDNANDNASDNASENASDRASTNEI